MGTTTAANQSATTLQALVESLQALGSATEAEEIHAIACATARKITGADGAAFILRDGKQCHYVEEDTIEPLWKGSHFPLDDCISGWSIVYRQAVAISDIELDDRVHAETYHGTYVRAMAMAPIRSTDPIGVLGTYWANTHTPSKAELSGLQALADATAVALENSTLNAYVLLDPLSNLYNRRGFFSRGAEQIAANRDGEVATKVLFAALNDIQELNDKFGYEAGDEAIRQTGAAIGSVCGTDVVIGRIAGNVFAVCGAEESLPRGDAEALERMVLDSIPGRGEQLGLTIGVAGAESGDPFDLDTLVAAANQTMFERRYGRPPSIGDQISRSAPRD